MIRKSRWNTGVSSLVSLVAVLVVACPPAHAQVKPFKVTGGGVASKGLPLAVDVPAPHWAVGQATELGNYVGSGFFEIDQFTGPLSGDFSSAVPFVFTAANGDDLAFDYAGTVELFPTPDGRAVAVFVATFTPALDLCTGRFAKVIGGSFVMTAITEPFVLGSTDPTRYTWSGEGTLEFRKGK
jgi:hypothetical protein